MALYTVEYLVLFGVGGQGLPTSCGELFVPLTQGAVAAGSEMPRPTPSAGREEHGPEVTVAIGCPTTSPRRARTAISWCGLARSWICPLGHQGGQGLPRAFPLSIRDRHRATRMASFSSDYATRISQSMGSGSDEEPLLDLAMVATNSNEGRGAYGEGGGSRADKRVRSGLARVVLG